MGIKLTILGYSSATPRVNANPTSQVLNINENFFLIDCGEGTQVQLRKYKFKFSSINNIFISHLHGDHFFGLMGLISSFHLLERSSPLNIFSPKGLKEIIDVQLKITNTVLRYPLNIHEIEDTSKSKTIFDDGKIEVITIPLEHRIPTNGYLFREKPKPRSIDKNLITKYNIPIKDIKNIKNGDDWIDGNGNIIPNRELTTSPSNACSYAFCSDTLYKEDIIPIIENVDILYHESTFLENEKNLAKKTFHSTAKQAATIAKLANVNKLILGHFSQRYKDENMFLNEAKEIFNNTELSENGKIFTFK